MVLSGFWTHAGRAALTDNFDACRDLSGRRLRHVNADQKLAEWQAEARERELEKVGLKHIKAQEKAAQREARQQVWRQQLLPTTLQRTQLAASEQQQRGFLRPVYQQDKQLLGQCLANSV